MEAAGAVPVSYTHLDVYKRQLPDGRVITRLKDVDAQVQAILGVTRKQFSQIAMIAQGEFRRLLQANTKERMEIFRGIFKTEGYATLQQQLKNEASRSREHCAALQQSVQQYVSGLRCEAEDPLASRVELAREGRLPSDEILPLLEQLLARDKQEAVMLEENLHRTEQQLDVLGQKLRDAAARAERESQKKAVQENLEQAEQRQQAVQSTAPVSYTHLDVYKRQVWNMVLFWKNLAQRSSIRSGIWRFAWLPVWKWQENWILSN